MCGGEKYTTIHKCKGKGDRQGSALEQYDLVDGSVRLGRMPEDEQRLTYTSSWWCTLLVIDNNRQQYAR